MNYQKELDRLLERLKSEERVPRLLLHSCCAPCSSYVLEYLSNYFEITVLEDLGAAGADQPDALRPPGVLPGRPLRPGAVL